jgi:hypothetical protein
MERASPPRPAWGGRAVWLGIAGVVAAVLAAAYAYHRGRVSAGLDVPGMTIERRELLAKAERLEKQNSELGAKVAELEMARRLDREAYGQVERSIGELQSQLSKQSEDLAFYRSIVSPEDGIQGLRIQRFDIQPGSAPREYVFKLTLIQAMRHESLASGLVQVVLHGMQADRPARYSVGELLGRPRAELPFSFRYFQTLEQRVTLPEAFQAFEAEVQVRSSKLRFPLQQSFPWNVANAADP